MEIPKNTIDVVNTIDVDEISKVMHEISENTVDLIEISKNTIDNDGTSKNMEEIAKNTIDIDEVLM